MVHARTSRNEVVDRALNATILLTNKTPVQRTAIEQLPHLRYIGVLATGYNVVDTLAARERQIPVTNAPGLSRPATIPRVRAAATGPKANSFYEVGQA